MTPAEFYSTYLPMAQGVSQRTGLDPRLVLAQAALESGWGSSVPGGNLFGIKSHGQAGGRVVPTVEYEGGQYVPQEASFRTYATPEASFQDYGSFILENPRYQPVMAAKNLEDQIAAMGASGYATDPEYARKLSSIVRMFGADGGSTPMAPQPQPQRPQGLLEQIGLQRMGTGGQQGDIPFHQRDKFRDFAGRLAMAANTLRQRPDPNIPAAVQAAQQQRSGNRTLDWLAQQPDGGRFAEIGRVAGPAVALQEYMKAQAGPEKTAAIQNYEYFRQMGMPHEQALAAAKGGQTINVGLGDQLSPYQEAQDKAFADLALDWKAGGLADLSQQRDTIAGVISDIAESDEPMSGPTVAAISKLGLGAVLTPEAEDVQQRVASVVQRTLKETLGAQFTQKEGEQLIARAYNPALSPEMNLRRLGALFDTIQQTVDARRSMIEYADKAGTLAGYTGPVPTNDDAVLAAEIEAAMNAVAAPAETTDVDGQLAVGTLDSGYRYIGGPPHLEISWEKAK